EFRPQGGVHANARIKIRRHVLLQERRVKMSRIGNQQTKLSGLRGQRNRTKQDRNDKPQDSTLTHPRCRWLASFSSMALHPTASCLPECSAGNRSCVNTNSHSSPRGCKSTVTNVSWNCHRDETQVNWSFTGRSRRRNSPVLTI